MTSSGVTPLLHYWVAARPIPGQTESGDQYVVANFDGGVLVAVIDGLGHGQDAADAAKLAAAVLAAHAHEPVVSLIKRCNEELRRTRGAVMSVASLTAAGSMNWIGVGNVEAMLVRAGAPPRAKRDSLLTRGGIVGDRLPQLHAETLQVHAGDLLFFATDGIGSMFVQDIRHVEDPWQLVHQLFGQYAKSTDDALLLGAQWMNASGTTATTDQAAHQPAPGIHP